jgi:hypothetical protein
MPLLDLKTDLKSIKYGHDRAGGGNSGQPYIQTDINTVDKGINKLRFGNFDEGLVRGGVIGMLNSSITDTLRIGKFLTDTPKGPLFIIKQVGLQLSNPRLETIKLSTPSSSGFLGSVAKLYDRINDKVGLGPTRIYNLGINTLAQVPINGIGGHIVRHGLLPVADPSKYYEAVVTANDARFGEGKNNRLVKLATKFGLGNPNYKEVSGGNKLIIDDYIGGPGSVYGIGTTLINRAKNRDTSDNSRIRDAFNYSEYQAGKTRISGSLGTGVAEVKIKDTKDFRISNITGSIYNPTKFNNSKYPELDGSFISNIAKGSDTGSHNRDNTLPERKNENDLVKNGPSSYPDSSITGSFKYTLPSLNLVYGPLASYTQIKKLNPSETTSNLDYGNTNNNPLASNGAIDQRLVGDQLPKSPTTPTYKNNYGDVITFKKPWREITREIRVGSGRQDQINLTPILDNIISYDGKDEHETSDGVTHKHRDLVKFRIQAINTNGPDFGSLMVFRAYLTAMSDSVDATWSPIKYAGRGDQFYIYDGFSRKMSVSFKVAALSAKEMQPMYQKLNFLMSNLMPDYENNLMRGPLVRMTIGNYIDAQLCKLDSVSYTIPQDSPWEIAMDEPEGGEKYLILPHIIEVQLNFTPIGSESKAHNKLQSKSQTISHIAQNNTGDIDFQYIK